MGASNERSRKKNTLKIVEDFNLQGSPAAVSRAKGIIYINPHLFYKLTKFEQKFILLHEEAHYVLDTSEETLCDKYAFDRLAGTEWRSLKQTLSTLNNVLPNSNTGKKERLLFLYKRALIWEMNNGNNLAKKELEKLNKSDDLDFVSGCQDKGWWIFKKKYCTTDPMGDAQAQANVNFTIAQTEELKLMIKRQDELLKIQADQKRGEAERNQKMIYLGIFSLVVILIFWK